MNRKLFVGNLPFTTTEAELQEAFGAVGAVERVRVIQDKDTGRSRGFAFVEMVTAADAEAAIQQFNQARFGGRRLSVSVAREKEPTTRDRGRREQREPARAARW